MLSACIHCNWISQYSGFNDNYYNNINRRYYNLSEDQNWLEQHIPRSYIVIIMTFLDVNILSLVKVDSSTNGRLCSKFYAFLLTKSLCNNLEKIWYNLLKTKNKKNCLVSLSDVLTTTVINTHLTESLYLVLLSSDLKILHTSESERSTSYLSFIPNVI